MFIYNIITFFDFYLFIALCFYIVFRFKNITEKERVARQGEKKVTNRLLKLLVVFLISTRLVKLMLYSFIFGHSLNPIGGTFGEPGHSQAWYECKLYAMPFMERFCTEAVEPDTDIEGACYPHRGYYPRSCPRLLKAAYDKLETQELKDSFVKTHVDRASQLKCSKGFYIYSYLTDFAPDSSYLRKAIRHSCLKDSCCHSCSSLWQRSPLEEHRLLNTVRALLYLEILDYSQKESNIICRSNFDKDNDVGKMLKENALLRRLDRDVILQKVKTEADKLDPSLFEKLNVDYSKYKK